jgi:predicted aspartyl protease
MSRLREKISSKYTARLLVIFLVYMTNIIFSGCSIIKTVKAFKGGSVVQSNEYFYHFEMIGHAIILKMKINNSEKEYNFIFDTGAITVLDKKVAEDLKIPVLSHVGAEDSQNNKSSFDVCKIDKVQLGDIIVKDLGSAVMDCQFITKILEYPIDGIIGNNFMKFFKIKLDYQSQTLSFSNQLSPVKSVTNAYLIPFDMNMSDGFAPSFPCNINSSFVVRGKIDTGFDGLISMPEDEVKKNNILENTSYIKAKGSTSMGAFSSNSYDCMFRIKSMAIDSLKLSNLVSTITPGKGEMLIGKEFLSRFIIEINYPARQLLLVSRNNISFPDNRFGLGIAAIKSDSGIYKIVGIWETSPADKAGLSIGDEIIEINSIKSQNISYVQYHRMLDDEKLEDFRLLVKNKQGIKTIELKKEILLK